MHHTLQITSNDYAHPRRPLPVTLAIQLGQTLARSGVQADLRMESLLQAAQAKAALQDFGDPSFRAPLTQLLRSLHKDARLHSLGRLMARQNLIRILVNRLRIQALLTQHPNIRSRPISAPVFIVGLQRTGTTLLHRLLACDPSFRHLTSWEAINPAPWPSPATGWRKWIASAKLAIDQARGSSDGNDPRINAARLAERSLAYLSPDFFAIHPVEANAPEEDCLLFDYSFYSTVPEATWHLPSFSRWLEQQDHFDAYQYYRQVLQLLDWQTPGRNWLLKTPHHMEHLDTLLTVFPDARIIHPHRDPVRALASFCSMIAHGRALFSDHVDPLEVGAHWSRKAHRMVDHCLEVRRQTHDEPFIDVAYHDLVTQPMSVIHRIYEKLGRPLTHDTAQRMHAWLPKNPQHKHGRHRYQLENFGLDPASESRAFAAYMQRFQIPAQGETP